LEEQQWMDFESIIPMPEELKISHNPDAELVYWGLYGSRILGRFTNHNPLDYQWVKDAGVKTPADLVRMLTDKDQENLLLAHTYRQNVEKHGHATGYSWRNKKWGTKWNAYAVTEWKPDNSIDFLTAWSPPFRVIDALAEIFPDLTLCLEYRDEMLNCLGMHTWLPGNAFRYIEEEPQVCLAA
jgi:hypothetical protein